MDASIQAGFPHTIGSSTNNSNHVELDNINPVGPRVFELEQKLVELQSKLNAVSDEHRRQKLTYDERDFLLKRKLSYLIDSVQADRPENLDSFDLVTMVEMFDDALRKLGMKLVRVTAASPNLIWEEVEKSMERLVKRTIEAIQALGSRQVSSSVPNPATDERQGTEEIRNPMPISEHHESLISQLNDVSNLLQAQRDDWQALKVLNDQRQEEKQTRQIEKDGRTSELRDMVLKIHDELAAEHARNEARRAGIETVLEALARQDQETRNLVNARWEDKRERRTEKDRRTEKLWDTLQRLSTDLAAEKATAQELRQLVQLKPGNEQVLEELLQSGREQKDLLNSFSNTWRADAAKHHEDTVNAVRSTAAEQVPFNVQGYLDDFSRALSVEVRTLLGEVGKLREERRTLRFEIGSLMSIKSKHQPEGEFGHDWKTLDPGKGEVDKLREERRTLQHEIGDLFLMKSKYGPGGEFDPDWKPPPPNFEPPPPPPPLPSPPATPLAGVPNHLQEKHAARTNSEDQAETSSSSVPAWLNACLEPTVLEEQRTSAGITSIPPPHPPSAWKNVHEQRAELAPEPPQVPEAQGAKSAWRRARRNPAPPAVNPRTQIRSWATWQPDPNLMPSPPSMQPNLIVPSTVDPRSQIPSWATWRPNFLLTPVQPNLIVPDPGSPGLFGPRSPRDSGYV